MRTTLAVAALLACSSTLRAQDLQISGHAGWGGRVVRGDWAPAAVDLDNRGGDRDLLISVGWAASGANQAPDLGPQALIGRMGPLHEERILLPARTRKRLSFSLLTPDSDRLSLWVFALDAATRKPVTRGELPVRPLEPGKRLIGVVGFSRPAGFDDGPLELASLAPDSLPEHSTGYSALDGLIWLDGKATEIQSTGQVDALRRWISSGGRFVIARANMLDLAGTPIAELLPVKPGASRELESLDVLQSTGNSATGPAGRAIVLDNSFRRGKLRLEREGLPIVVEAAHDGGSTLFLAFDPSRAPFSTWDGAATFWRWLVPAWGTAPLAPAQNEAHAPRAIGCVALAQQASRFPDVSAPQVGSLILLIVLYLVVVGPFDYLLLRWLRRLELTWFTFPSYVVLFTGFILYAGGAFLQRAASQREIAVTDHFIDSGFSRRRVLSAVLASGGGVYRVEDALPLSSNFYSQSMYVDTASQVTDVRVSGAEAHGWALERGSTGLVIADRCGSEKAPLRYVIDSLSGVEVRMSVSNASGREYQGSTLLTPQGVYWISSIPVGESKVDGSRIADTLEQYADKEGRAFLRNAQYEEQQQWRGRENRSYSEAELRPEAQRVLVGLSVPQQEQRDRPAEVLSGMARNLDATPWVRSGGSVLLAWSGGETGIRFHPAPSKHSSVTLYRFFQRASP